MSDNDIKRVRLTDRMVLAGIGMGAIYWVIETILYVISSQGISFYDRLLGPDLCARNNNQHAHRRRREDSDSSRSHLEICLPPFLYD